MKFSPVNGMLLTKKRVKSLPAPLKLHGLSVGLSSPWRIVYFLVIGSLNAWFSVPLSLDRVWLLSRSIRGHPTVSLSITA
jgi:hypothetical protein